MTGKFDVPLGNKSSPIPGVYYLSDDSAMVPQRGSDQRRALLIAQATGGQTGQPILLRPGDESMVLKSGLGAQMAAAMFTHGAREVLYLSPTVATAASIDLGLVKLAARNPGRPGRGIQVLTADSAASPDAFTLLVRDATGAYPDETYPDLGPVLVVSHLGVGAGTPGITFLRREDGLMELTFDDGVESHRLVVDSAQAPTFTDLATLLNGTGSWAARITGDGSFPLSAVDGRATVTFTEGRAVLGVGVNALVYKLRDSRMVTAVQGNPATALRLTNEWEFLSGGSDAAVATTAQWVAALRGAELLDVQGIVMGTSDAAALAALAAHVDGMTDVLGKRERTGTFGAAAQPSKAGYIDAAVALASTFSDQRLLSCVGNDPYQADVMTGQLALQPAAVAAAGLLALRHSMSVEEPTTAKLLRFPKWKYEFSTEELTRLIEGGVMPVAMNPDAGRVLITAGITTYTLDANTMRRKQAGVEIDLYLARKARKVLFPLSVGKVADEARLKVMLSAVQKMLEDETRSGTNPRGIITPGTLADGTREPAFKNLEIVFDGFDVVGVDFEAHPVGEIGFVLFRPRWTPVRQSASA